MAKHTASPSWTPDRSSILAATLVAILAVVLVVIGATNYATTGSVSFHPTAAASPITLVGDDNGDGRIDEDETGWDCSTMGNRSCGPVLPDAVVLPDGGLRLACPAYGDMISRDGSESADSMICVPA